MTHEIKNQHGKHIIDKRMRNEINHMLEKALDHSYVDEKKIEIVKDFRTDKKRETVVFVEGI